MKAKKSGRDYKWIAVSPDTYVRLKELGKMGDSMDSVIQRLLPREQQVLKVWQCTTCGMFVSGSRRPPSTFKCVQCGSDDWRQGSEDF